MTNTTTEVVDRWKHCEYPNQHKHFACNDGDWVRYGDYCALTAERDALARELAAEKALADQVAVSLEEMFSQEYWGPEQADALAAYRKARGL